MKIMIGTDVVVLRYDEKLYLSNVFGMVLKRYYNKFGKVILCTRVKTVSEVPEKMCDVTELIEKVVNMGGLLKPLLHMEDKRIIQNMEECDLVVGRVPCIIAYRLFDCAKKLRKPFFSELMGCAWDAYWNHGIAGKIIAPYMYLKMKRVVKNADYGLYVTEKFLQKRYPCKNETVSASNVKITDVSDEVFDKRVEKILKMDKNNISLMTSAAVDVRYKGHEYVIKAIPKLKEHGINVTYYIVGGGDQTYLRKIAENCGVLDNVFFTGLLTLEEVFEHLDKSDIYIQPSLQEGLPRAMIEAMSRGCVCLGAKTAGIPELVDAECIFKRKSVSSIVKCISEIVKKDLTYYAKRNFEEAKKYKSDVLDERRNKYFGKVKTELE